MASKQAEIDQVQGWLGSGFRVLDIQEVATVEERRWLVASDQLELCASEADAKARIKELTASSQQSRDGLWWVAGLPEKSRNERFSPVIARGQRYDHGEYWQWFESDSDLQSGIEGKEAELTAGTWSLTVPGLKDEPEYLRRAAQRQIKMLEARLGLRSQAWRRHIHEVLYALVGGFVLFEQLWDADGGVRYNWIWPSQVERWILNERKSEVIGVKLYDTAEILPMSRLCHYRWGSYGIDPEGLPLLRCLGLLIDLKQQLLNMSGIAFDAFGVPWLGVEQTEKGADAGDDKREVIRLSKVKGKNRVVVKLKYGHKLVVVQASGQMPDGLPLIRYVDEKIRQRLRDDAALLGAGGGGGSYALAEQREADKLRSSYHVAMWFASSYSEQVIKRLMVREGIAPVRAGLWPELKYDLGLEDKRQVAQDLAVLSEKGLILATPKVIKQVHEWYELDTSEIDTHLEEREARRVAQEAAAKEQASKQPKEGEDPAT